MRWMQNKKMYIVSDLFHFFLPHLDVHSTKGSHFCVQTPWRWRGSNVEQHEGVWFHLSFPHVLVGLCGCEICQQAGFHLSGLCHRLHRVHLCWSAGLSLQTSTFPVSAACVFCNTWPAFRSGPTSLVFPSIVCAYWGIELLEAMSLITASAQKPSGCWLKSLQRELMPTSPLL